MDFWCHVVQCTTSGLESTGVISSLDWGGETKVSDLQIVVFVEQQIFRLEVSVGNSHLVAVVESLKKLFEEVTSKWLFKSTSVGNVVE